MKGLLKGLRYISHIFDEHEKEPEMEIGNPTDVKHVAHIGWDGPSASKPSWMNEIEAAPELSNGTSNSIEEVQSRSVLPPSSDCGPGEKQKRRSRRQTNALVSPINSPNRTGTEGRKQSRRQRSSTVSMDSPSRESTGAQSSRQLEASNLGVGSESPGRDQLTGTRHSRRKKTKEPSKLKDKSCSPDMRPSLGCEPEGSECGKMQRTNSYANHLTSVLEVYDKGL